MLQSFFLWEGSESDFYRRGNFCTPLHCCNCILFWLKSFTKLPDWLDFKCNKCSCKQEYFYYLLCHLSFIVIQCQQYHIAVLGVTTLLESADIGQCCKFLSEDFGIFSIFVKFCRCHSVLSYSRHLKAPQSMDMFSSILKVHIGFICTVLFTLCW